MTDWVNVQKNNIIENLAKENEQLKKENNYLLQVNKELNSHIENDFYFQECKKISEQIEKMKCCGNCATGKKPVSKEKIQFCCSCRCLDEQKENIIYKYWKLAE